jgi:predicted DNA-binding protein
MADHNEQNEEWETVAVEVERPVSAVVSVRLSTSLAEQVSDLARAQGLGVSALVREALENYIAGVEHTPASFDVTISSADGPVALFQGKSSLSRTESQPAWLIPA